jgi:hypothetical protein
VPLTQNEPIKVAHCVDFMLENVSQDGAMLFQCFTLQRPKVAVLYKESVRTAK